MTIIVAGLINIETTVKVERFPIDYIPEGFMTAPELDAAYEVEAF